MKDKVSIGILSWKREEILEQTIKSYIKNGLFSLSDDITIYFNEINAKDIEIAKKYNLKYIGTEKNIGIQQAIKALADNAKNDYFLFLENDWELIESFSMTKSILQDSISLLAEDKVNVVRLRSARKPGEPCTTKELKRTPHLIDKDGILNLIIITKNPSKIFPDLIKEILLKNKFYIADSQNSQYTNNPCIYRREFLQNIMNKKYERNSLINLFDYAKSKQTSEDKICLEADIIPYWSTQHFKVAVCKGLFTHKDYIKRQKIISNMLKNIFSIRN